MLSSVTTVTAVATAGTNGGLNVKAEATPMSQRSKPTQEIHRSAQVPSTKKQSVKEWLHDLQPLQLYVILALTTCFFAAELFVAHITHALTLLMDSYHMLCNIIALTGCIITIKRGKSDVADNTTEPPSLASSVGDVTTSELTKCQDKKKHKITQRGAQRERKLRNTFGWTRIDVIVMLICCVFLASLSFSLVVEALQTLFHIDHQHEVHEPIFVVCIGATGLLLNGICYLLIGGFTFHQGSFLYVTESGDVVLDRVVTHDSVHKGQRRLSSTKRQQIKPQYRQRQGCREMMRDVIGSVFVIICGLATFLTESHVAKFVDPLLAILSSTMLMYFSYPYMKESGLILLQTIPGSINIDSIKTQLIDHFPDIINVHDLHVWQMTATKVISTAHIIFQNPKGYHRIIDEVRMVFTEHGITQVTIQPEFFKAASVESLEESTKSPLCLVKCTDEACLSSYCCPTEHLQLQGWKSREVLTSVSTTSLNKDAETPQASQASPALPEVPESIEVPSTVTTTEQ